MIVYREKISKILLVCSRRYQRYSWHSVHQWVSDFICQLYHVTDDCHAVFLRIYVSDDLSTLALLLLCILWNLNNLSCLALCFLFVFLTSVYAIFENHPECILDAIEMETKTQISFFLFWYGILHCYWLYKLGKMSCFIMHRDLDEL